MIDKSALDTFKGVLNKLLISYKKRCREIDENNTAYWKKISDKDYKTIEKIYFKLGGK